MDAIPPIKTTAADYSEARQNSHPQRMRFPCDADTTRRLKWIIKGNQQVPWLRRIIRRVKERFNAVGT